MLQFRGCTLDIQARRLLRGTHEIHLSPKAFELLKVLIEARPSALTKAELLERVWPGVFVTDASLARVVTEVRQALRDRAREGGAIRTVHGYGYAFGADVEAVAPSPPSNGTIEQTCWLVTTDRTFGLIDGEHIVGREPGVSVWLDSPKVSRHHARVVVQGDAATVEDLSSTNGTFVRDERIAAPVVLESGDKIRIGPFTLTFLIAGSLAPTEREASS
jgi:DNA-binding winged helix-turn-helix (wHTH) protein